MFDCYKWDPYFLDNNTIAKHVLVLTKEEHEELKTLTEKLDKETREAEEFLNNHQGITKPLALPRQILNDLKHMDNVLNSNIPYFLKFCSTLFYN